MIEQTEQKIQEVSLARALKEKSRLVTELRNLQKIITRENSKLDTSTSTVDLGFVWNRYNTIEQYLINLKTRICLANNGIIGLITEMAELKSRIIFLQSISTIDGEQISQNHFAKDPLKLTYKAHMKQEDVDAQVNYLQQRIHKLQDQIDEYNATTKIRIECF